MPLSHNIQITNPAKKQIKKLPPIIQKIILKTIEKLSKNPKPPQAKKLIGIENLYRIRTHQYRILYTIHQEKTIILVVKIGHRKDVYRRL